MQISDRSLAVKSSTLSTLIAELDTECSKVPALINQLPNNVYLWLAKVKPAASYFS
ncbi:hypothetical protein LC593_06725 [Nostoc sp. CHAB 5844]|nr:hypothetical protein [Nostoc sp. CHAB 5844]